MTQPFRPGGPPVWLGGGSDSALRRTGRLYDGWLPYPPSAGTYAEGLAAGARHLVIRIAAGPLAAQREQLEELIKLKPLLTAG
jgi:alkanesulfonate monooxygenase SsuD/methylene tetrahydromethanopterin reductase-like flavin-dependent oxidoreductase (luciferase family)